MPIHLRQFHIRQISEFNKKQNAEYERATQNTQSSTPKGPSVKN